MPYITVILNKAQDALMKALAKRERRSKREQMAVSAIEHARSILPDFGQPKKKEESKQ